MRVAERLHSERILDDTADFLGPLTTENVFHVLARILELREVDVRRALSQDGTLSRCGLVSVDRSGPNLLRAKLDLLSDKFADCILAANTDPASLIRDMVRPSALGHLTLNDFTHIDRQLQILLPYLQNAIKNQRKGVNILLYGVPGTGKNQLTKALASELCCQLFEVASADSDGDPINGEQRLRAFRAAQHFFASRPNLLLFDEVEDIFGSRKGFFSPPSIGQMRKAWVNRTLEDNPVPTLWLTNSIRGIDPAYIRRFDLIFELPIPPQHQRERMVRNAGGDLLDAFTATQLSKCDQVTPAVVTRAVAVVESIRDRLPISETAEAIAMIVSNTLEA
jgi:hypothetical protein